MLEIKIKEGLGFKKREPIRDVTNYLQNNFTPDLENEHENFGFLKLLLLGTAAYVALNFNDIRTRVSDFFYRDSSETISQQSLDTAGIDNNYNRHNFVRYEF